MPWIEIRCSCGGWLAQVEAVGASQTLRLGRCPSCRKAKRPSYPLVYVLASGCYSVTLWPRPISLSSLSNWPESQS